MHNLPNLKQIPKRSYISGVPNYANDFILAQIINDNKNSNYLYITANEITLKNSVKSLHKMISDYEVIEYPAWDCQPYDRIGPNSHIQAKRLSALYEMANSSKPLIIVSTYSALLNKVMPIDDLNAISFSIQKDENINQDELLRKLVHAGFRNSSTVTEVGEFSRKGSILDIFLASYAQPVRLDFFGDKIDDIKFFDPLSQTSTKQKIKKVKVVPSAEVILNESNIDCFTTNFAKYFSYDDTQSLVYQETINGVVGNMTMHLLPLYYQNLATIFDYLPNDLNIIIGANAEAALEERVETIKDYYRTRKINFDKLKVKVRDYLPLDPDLLYLSSDIILDYCEKFNNLIFDIKSKGNFDYYIRGADDFHKSSLALKKSAIEIFKAQIDDKINVDKHLIVVICAFNDYSLDQIKHYFS